MTQQDAVLLAFAWVVRSQNDEEFEIRGPAIRIGPSIRVDGITCAALRTPQEAAA